MLAEQQPCLHYEETRLFNHDILSCTHEDVSGNHLYSGRALGLTEPRDVIQLHPFLKREWPTIGAHYRRIGLPHSSNVVWDISPQRMTDYPLLKESLFFFGPAENNSRSNQRWQQVVEHINDKNNFMALASHLGLNIPPTRCFTGKQWFAGFDKFSYPCYLKPAVSVAGKGIHRCENQAELIQALCHFDEDVPLQLQDEVDASVFLNLQYQASDAGCQRLLASEQVLKGFTHQGNRYPASHEPWESVEPMAEWLWEKGIRGVFAFDVGVIHASGGAEFVPIECNPRFNGASYPSGIACRLQLPEWISRDFNTRYDKLADIDLTGIEFDPSTRTGVIVVNWGTVLVGKIGVLLAGTPEQQAALEAELQIRL
jgi:hypothetical protein